MTCKHNMVHLDTKKNEDWDFNDIYEVKIVESWECDLCGQTEQVDVSDEWLCENPY